MHPSRGDDVDLARPVRRWKGYGKPQRTEIFIRWSLYITALLQPVVALSALTNPASRSPLPRPAVLGIMAASVVGSAVFMVCCRVSLAHYLGRRARPTGWLLTSAAVMLGSFWTALLVVPAYGNEGVPTNAAATSWLLVFWFAPIAIALPVRAAALAGLSALVLTAPALVVGGVSASTAAGLLLGTGFMVALFGGTCRGSAWIVAAVWELDAAREAQSRLAVAEERLRFSRDLHDVLGRNLTTIALKSELAVQLARRGRAEAADQMTEVQRIAQESQREVREVVRGYRTADLQAEVTGARSVLRAAGVTCEIDLGQDAGALPPVAQSLLGWVVREATTNVLRHSEAVHCSVRLRLTEDQARLEVENDGVTERREPAEPSGTGLLGLSERLAAYGGELALPQAAPGRFRLTAALPLTTPALEVAAP